MATRDKSIDYRDQNVVLIAGGGPVGLLAATVLAHYGVRSVILERNESTTRDNMDLTNSRSMELLARLGLIDDIRKLGVPSTAPYNVYMTSGLHNEEPMTGWVFPNVDTLRSQSQQQNDGTFPSEPWQRISQAIFEKFLKERCDNNPLIECRFGWRVDRTVETTDGVVVEATDTASKSRTTFSTKYLLACDGASSRVRRELEIPLDGGPFPGYALLVHFKSRDLEKLFKFGRFWHLFIFNQKGLHAAAICQDDKDTFTTHLLLPLDADADAIDSYDAVYRSLGGMRDPFRVKIDEILIRSTYRQSIAVARSYRSPLGKVFLAGDSAHQNIPTGGYGMNLGIGDAFDIGWKLAAVILKKAAPKILDSYEEERRAIALKCVQRSGVHMEAHSTPKEILGENPLLVEEDSPDGAEMRRKMHEHYQQHNGENQDLGIEMDHRHESSVYPQPEVADGEEPPWDASRYTPSTFVGSRAPHVFLSDGSAIFDHYGPFWTLVEFSDKGDGKRNVQTLLDEAQKIGMPLKHVIFHDEERARQLWQLPLVLVRPDGHVAWRGRQAPEIDEAARVLKIISGQEKDAARGSRKSDGAVTRPFAATTEVDAQVKEYRLAQMGAMQM
ncbi:FAD-binding domain-containing protein [Dactylonectria macrodidyma]|uniref:FAD-binding domain-containing protein n=1 Tax=Dactylonectria macrodidyma TaxID=307937 RepID=A0A9P9CZS7_9HYPO|nr:FAD-binding domain-containing protein [Dactylonectria macrodidyma]